jgi:hypothetical protein
MVQSSSATFVRGPVRSARAIILRLRACIHGGNTLTTQSPRISVLILRAALQTATVCIYNNSKGQTNERASELPVDNAPVKTQRRSEKNLAKRATGSSNTASVLGK